MILLQGLQAMKSYSPQMLECRLYQLENRRSEWLRGAGYINWKIEDQNGLEVQDSQVHLTLPRYPPSKSQGPTTFQSMPRYSRKRFDKAVVYSYIILQTALFNFASVFREVSPVTIRNEIPF